MWPLIVADLLLAAGFTARLTRFIVTDDLGKWWIRDPLDGWFHKPPRVRGPQRWRRMRWHKYLSGLVCPWCVGWWIGVAVLASLALTGGPGHAAELWRWTAGAFTLNWITAHIGVRLGDAGYSDD